MKSDKKKRFIIPPFRLSLKSRNGRDRDYPRETPVIEWSWNYRTRTLKLPKFLNDWVPARVTRVKTQYLKENFEYDDVKTREYGFSYFEGSVTIYYGVQTDSWGGDDGSKSKTWFLPWTEWRFIRHSIVDAANTKVVYSQFEKDRPRYKKGITPEQREQLWTEGRQRDKELDEARERNAMYFMVYDDYMKRSVPCRIVVEEREWRFGVGYFKWLSLFRKPMVRRVIDINFLQEVGPKSGSWKGGLIGTSADISPGELPGWTLKLWCLENKLARREEISIEQYKSYDQQLRAAWKKEAEASEAKAAKNLSDQILKEIDQEIFAMVVNGNTANSHTS